MENKRRTQGANVDPRTRNTLIKAHLLLAAFLAPMVLLVAISGGLFLLGVEGSYDVTPTTLPFGATLDPESPTLDDDLRRVFDNAGIDYDFERIGATTGTSEIHGDHTHDDTPAESAGDDGHHDTPADSPSDDGHHHGSADDNGDGHHHDTPDDSGMEQESEAAPESTTVTTLITYPTSRTNYQVTIAADGSLEAKRRVPSLQKRMIELHRGQGPALFKHFQRLMALGLLAIVTIGLIMGLTSPALRTTTLATAAAGLLLFLLLTLLA